MDSEKGESHQLGAAERAAELELFDGTVGPCRYAGSP